MLVNEKVNQAIGILSEFDVDCWITFVRESELNGDPVLDYILGVPVTWHSVFIITAAGETIAIVGKYDKQTVIDTGAYNRVLSFVVGVKELFIRTIRLLNPSKIAINYSKDSEICDGLTHGMYLTLFDFLAGIDFENRLMSAEKIVSALRQRKTETEISYIKEAIRETESIFAETARFIQPGKTEKEIAEFMKSEVNRRHLGFAWDEHTCPAVFSGPDTAGAHYAPTDRTVEKGHLLNMDFGVRYNGYCSDMQRTFYVLKEDESEPPPEVRHGFQTIVSAIEMAKQALKPGRRGFDVDKVARDYLLENGYEEYQSGLGHQVGRFAHDGTALLGPDWEKYAQKPFQPVEEGMVFTLEPRLTVPGYGLATIEEIVLVTATGAEFLSKPQKEIILIK